jgi:hypothetical protein
MNEWYKLNTLLNGKAYHAVSFHITDEVTKEYTDSYLFTLRNMYANDLMECYDYISDSTGVWRYGNLMDRINSATKPIYVLIHPEWWFDLETTEPIIKIASIIDHQTQLKLNDLKQNYLCQKD